MSTFPPEVRVIATQEISNVILQKTTLATFLTKEDAVNNALEASPYLPWSGLFDGLEAAGLLSFAVGED
jgi:hypothetical protein